MGDLPDHDPGGGRVAVEIIAHRGYSARYPENTLPALEGALKSGARSLEWDVRISSDGVPVVFHDETLDRTTDGDGRLVLRTARELRRLDAGSWFDPAFRGVRIPRLDEALRRVRGRAHRVYVEVKALRRKEDLDTILELLRRSAPGTRATLISLDPDLVRAARRRDPGIPLGWVVARDEALAPLAREAAADDRSLLAPDARLLLRDPERTRRLVETGIPLVTWTVDDPAEAGALHALGVARITTNRVSRLLTWARGAVGEPTT